jgi:hypothetical protein
LLQSVGSGALLVVYMLHKDQTVPLIPAPGPLEHYAAHFDDLSATNATLSGVTSRGLLLPAERNKTLTALANTEPVVGAQRKGAQSLQ